MHYTGLMKAPAGKREREASTDVYVARDMSNTSFGSVLFSVSLYSQFVQCERNPQPFVHYKSFYSLVCRLVESEEFVLYYGGKIYITLITHIVTV